MALTEECDLQAYVDVKSRSTTYEIRTGDFDEQPLSVRLVLRKYWSADQGGSLLEEHRRLFDLCERLAAEQVVPVLVTPLAQRIARS